MRRRPFLTKLATFLAAVPIACAATTSNAEEQGQASQESPAGAAKKSTGRKLGIALVGLGYYSTQELGPALKVSSDTYLAAVVTGSPNTKGKEWAKEYGFPETSIYDYQNFDEIAKNSAVDIVYVVLPNSMHKEFTLRAAKAGKHVICEKPMAMTPQECRDMIAACEVAGVKLGIGYRCHYDPYNRKVMDMTAARGADKVRFVRSHAGYQMGDNWEQWRLKKDLAGTGALGNMGVYAMQGAIYAVGEDPIAVSAQEYKTMPEKFAETDETVTFQLRFPSGAVANCATSHNANMNELRVDFAGGDFADMDRFSAYRGQTMRTHEGEVTFPATNQQAEQMDAFARHVRDGAPNLVPGSMGLRDMIIIEAILESIANGGQEVTLDFG